MSVDADHKVVKPIRITVAHVREVLEKIAAESPDMRDRRAGVLVPRYIDQGEPGCLVAIVLTRLGFPLSMLRALDREHRTGDIFHAGVRIEESRNPSLRRIDKPARQLLAYVQRNQDRGVRWGAIVRDSFRRPPLVPDWWVRERKPWLFGEES